MNFKKYVLVGIGVLLLAVLSLMIFPRRSTPPINSPQNPGGAPYSRPGSFQVGLLTQRIAADPPLGLTIWYPAQTASQTEKAYNYPYKIKMGKPLGMVTIAQYQGRSVPEAAPDTSAAPYPLVILSPGFSISSTSYAWLAEHLASYGFVVISPDHNENLDPENQLWRRAITRPQDIHAVLAYAADQLQVVETLQGLIDINSVAVVGHSYGGYTALIAGGARIDTESFRTTCQVAQSADQPGAWLCDMLLPHLADMADLAGLNSIPEGLWPDWGDERVKAIVPIAGDGFFFGQPGLSQIGVPVLAIGGTADVDSPYSWGTHPSFKYSTGPRKAEVGLVDAEHMIFTGPCESIRWYLSFLSGEFCSDPNWDRSYAHEITKHFTAAFLLAELKADKEALHILTPGVVAFDGIRYESYGY